MTTKLRLRSTGGKNKRQLIEQVKHKQVSTIQLLVTCG